MSKTEGVLLMSVSYTACTCGDCKKADFSPIIILLYNGLHFFSIGDYIFIDFRGM